MCSYQEHDAWSLKKQSVASIDKLKKLSNKTNYQIAHPYAIGYTADQIATLFRTANAIIRIHESEGRLRKKQSQSSLKNSAYLEELHSKVPL